MPNEPALPAWATQAIDELHACDRWANALARNLGAGRTELETGAGCVERRAVPAPPLRDQRTVPPGDREGLDGRPVHPVQEITPGWFARFFIRNYIAPPAPGARLKTRARAPRQIAPAMNVDPSVLDQLLRTNDTARDLFRRAGSSTSTVSGFRTRSSRWCGSPSARGSR